MIFPEPSMGDDAWDQLGELHEAERNALLRVSRGASTLEDAMLLAASLHHADLFIPQEPVECNPED